MADWKFYIIQNGPRTYAGVSPDPVRRLRQHNKELAGGAKYTTAFAPGWTHKCIITGFQTKQQALQFEWAVKHCRPRGKGGITNRMLKLQATLSKDKWTSKACNACDVPLEVCVYGVAVPSPLPVYVTMSS
jgi:predicted GIY-YIG superfamily endonuclease